MRRRGRGEGGGREAQTGRERENCRGSERGKGWGGGGGGAIRVEGVREKDRLQRKRQMGLIMEKEEGMEGSCDLQLKRPKALWRR